MSPYIAVGLPKSELQKYQVSHISDITQKVIKTVAEFYKINWLELMSRRRTREVADARQIAMYLIRNNSKLGVVEIGRLFNRDHSTVIYATQTVQDLIDTDKSYRFNVKEIEKKLFSVENNNHSVNNG